ncbi:MAG: molybdenum cofactor biosynthesis protein MoaE [Fimbriimonadaceae bacterium]|nr:molybdenum cofactor biosynthesis protein MoaE [Fimbriimonadaceae bacterium]
MVVLTTAPLDVSALERAVADPTAGAVLTFVGTVRNHHRGRATSHLVYEAYEPMAEAELQRLLAAAAERWPIARAAVAHRLGRLEIGEAAVAVVVSSAHRGEAFEACRWIMDQIKHDVPIWKHETWATGDSEWIGPEPQENR